MKKTLLSRVFLFFTILIVAFVLRTYKISVNPPSLSWDEVSIGYNAYSILKTGKDEHGRFLPFDAFAGYGDYKPPLSIYLTVPFVSLFGMNEFSVRLPSALFGSCTVLLTFFLVRQLFSKIKTLSLREQKQNRFIKDLPLVAMGVLAVSPWHINLSRAGFEANIALFFVVLGVYSVLKAIETPKLWIIAWIPFIATVYTFNSSRYFVPILGIGLTCFAYHAIRKNIRYFGIGIVIALMLMIPIVPHLVSKEARLRFTEVNIFTDPEIVLDSNRRIEQTGYAWWAKIIFNRRVGYTRSYALHFLDHFQPEYLFIKGDGNPKFSIQDTGQLYLIEAPFLVIGILSVLILYPSIGFFLLFWMIMAIVPAAVARETPHALRTLNSIPTWHIFTAFGIIQGIQLVLQISNKKIVRNMFLVVFLCLYSFSIVYYLHSYYMHYPTEYSGEWQYGYKQALEFIRPIEKNFDTIYMTDSIGRPYMYALFNLKIDPNEFFRTKDASFDAAGFYHVYGFGKYRFVKDMPTDCSGKCLYITTGGTDMKKSKLLHTVKLLNGSPVLNIYE